MRPQWSTLLLLLFDKYKKTAVIYSVNGDGPKTAKVLKRRYYSPSLRLNVNVMLSNNFNGWGSKR